MRGEAGALAGLVGRCPAIESLKRELALLGRGDAKVHVFGETGTGKEKVARALHELSPRAKGPYVPVNAAGFTDEMLAAELFGHTRGAFTGAVGDRAGLIAQAEGGTLFIDEVAELSAQGQARLLRFLQEGEYQRLGESTRRRADVRVISATNADLGERVQSARFRKDLKYRLEADRIVVPPLRERGEDILLLARHFLKAEAAKRGVPPPELSPATEAALLAHDWPGNVRELENEMQRLVVRAAGQRVEPSCLRPELRAEQRRPSGTLRLAVRRLEAEMVTQVIARHSGSVARAAAELGITRQALWAKKRRLENRQGDGEAVLSSPVHHGRTR
jgi:two-component system NtrC family response regulator